MDGTVTRRTAPRQDFVFRMTAKVAEDFFFVCLFFLKKMFHNGKRWTFISISWWGDQKENMALHVSGNMRRCLLRFPAIITHHIVLGLWEMTACEGESWQWVRIMQKKTKPYPRKQAMSPWFMAFKNNNDFQSALWNLDNWDVNIQNGSSHEWRSLDWTITYARGICVLFCLFHIFSACLLFL